MEGENLLRSLPRKELQSLCKQYGLPARKSSAEMAYSLYSYFQKRDLNSISSGKILSGVGSLVPALHYGTQSNLRGNAIKDGFGELRPFPNEDGNEGNVSERWNGIESCVGHKACNKEKFGGSLQFVNQFAAGNVFHHHKESPISFGGWVGDTPQFERRDKNLGAFPIENASSSLITTTRPPASFEFYVSSEEGIKLSVDLNSSPLDWIKKYKDQVNLSENLGTFQSRSLHQERGYFGESNEQMNISIPQSTDSGQIKDDQVPGEATPSAVVEKNSPSGNDHPDEDNKCLMSPPAIPCNIAVDVSEYLEEDQGLISSKPSSDGQNQMLLNTESSVKNGCSATLDSDILDPPQEKTACNFAVNSVSDGSVDVVSMDHQNSKRDDEVCQNSTVQNGFILDNASVIFPGCLTGHSTRMQLSEAGNNHKDASCSYATDLHNVETKRDLLANSADNDPYGNHLPTCSEEQEWSNNVNGRESSVCSKVENSFGMTCSKSDNVRSNTNGEVHKKRPRAQSEGGQNGCSKRDPRILRSMKHSAGEVFPRRSMRLVSK